MTAGQLPGFISSYVSTGTGAAPVLEELRPPRLEAAELLVKVEAAMVGPQELAALDWPGVPGGAASGHVVATGDAALGWPGVPGGAASGHVVATGDAARDYLGRRVLVGPLSACGNCEACGRGRFISCRARARLGIDVPGTLASHVAIDKRWVSSLAGPLDDAAPGPWAAAIPREATWVYTLCARAGVAPGETTIWLGKGPLAVLGQRVATALGAHAILLEDSELALDPRELAPNLRARLAKAGAPSQHWKVFEVSGATASRRRAEALGAEGGTTAFITGRLAGLHDELHLEIANDGTVIVSAAPHPDLVIEVAALIKKGELRVQDLVKTFSQSELPRVIAGLREGKESHLLHVILFE